MQSETLMAYSCKDRKPFQPFRHVQDGWYKDGRRRMKLVANNFEQGCRYAEHGYAAKDVKCADCKHMENHNGTV